MGVGEKDRLCTMEELWVLLKDRDAVGEKDGDWAGDALFEGVDECEAVLVGVPPLVGVWLMVWLSEGEKLTLSAPVTVEWVATEAVGENVRVRSGLAVAV